MSFRLKPLALFICLSIANPFQISSAVAQEASSITSTTLPDHINASGTGVGFAPKGPASLDINLTTRNSVINWNGNGFNVGSGATVNFKPGLTNSAVLNFDNSGSKSLIEGTVNHGGAKLFLVNPNGIADSSGAFTGLFATEKDNVSFTSDGKLRISTQGNRVYGDVSGNVNKDQALTIVLEDSEGEQHGNFLIGGSQTTVELPSRSPLIRAGGLNFQSDAKIVTTAINDTTLVLEDVTAKKLESSLVKNLEITGETDIGLLKAYIEEDENNIHFHKAKGNVGAVEMDNGTLHITQGEGTLTLNNLRYHAQAGEIIASVDEGGVLEINNGDILLNSGGGLDEDEEWGFPVEEEETASPLNQVFFSTAEGGTGGIINIRNTRMMVETTVEFTDADKNGELNLTNTKIYMPSSDIIIKANESTRLESLNGKPVEIGTDHSSLDEESSGVVIIDSGVQGSFETAGREYYDENSTEAAEFQTDESQILIDFNKTTISGGGLYENEQAFADGVSVPSEPGESSGEIKDFDSVTWIGPYEGSGDSDEGSGGTTPTDPGDTGGTEPGSGGDTGGDTGTTNPGDGGDTGGTDPGDGGDTGGDTGTTNPGDGGDTGGDTGTTNPGDGGDTGGDTGTTNPGDGGDTGGTDPGDGGDTGGTTPGTGTGGDTGGETGGDTGTTNPGDGGDTGGTDPGDGGNTGGTTPGTGTGGDTGTTNPGDGGDAGGTTPGTGTGGDTGTTNPGDGSDTGGTTPGTGSGGDTGTTNPGDGDGTGTANPGNGGGTGDDTDTTNPGDGGGAGGDEGSTDPDNGSGPDGGSDGTTPGSGSGGGTSQPGTGSGGEADGEEGSIPGIGDDDLPNPDYGSLPGDGLPPDIDSDLPDFGSDPDNSAPGSSNEDNNGGEQSEGTNPGSTEGVNPSNPGGVIIISPEDEDGKTNDRDETHSGEGDGIEPNAPNDTTNPNNEGESDSSNGGASDSDENNGGVIVISPDGSDESDSAGNNDEGSVIIIGDDENTSHEESDENDCQTASGKLEKCKDA